jgi:voltage-gated potassium channel Kch
MRKINLIPNDYILKKHPDISWRKWLQMVWNDLEWPTVIIVGLISLTLGVIGFLQYSSPGKQLPFWDSLYESLQLFSLQVSFNTDIPIPTFLQIARFLSPAIAAYALAQAFMVVFKEQLELFRLVRTTNHFIICGLGQKGLLLTKNLRKVGQRVVVIEHDSNNPHLEICRELGAIVIIGNARESKILLKAGIQQATHLIAVCSEDGTNVEVAEQAERLMQGYQRQPLKCTIHIADPYLWAILREREFAKEKASPIRVEMFNIYDTGARVLLKETLETYDSGRVPHFLIIGMGNLAEYLIVHAARAWCLQGEKVAQKLRITVVDPDVKNRLANLKVRFPLLINVCEFFQQEQGVNWPNLQEVIFPEKTDKRIPVTNAYICFEDSTFGLQTGFTLLQYLEDQDRELMINMTENSGLAAFLRETLNPKFKNLRAFGILENTCKIELMDDGTHEALARIIHEDYLEQEKQKGLPEKDSPSLVPWENLPDGIKESNRRQADHIGIKLASVGCGIKPWREYGKEKFQFRLEQIFTMAKMEHTRWCEEKKQEGWKYGDKRDDTKKLHSDLVDWESLSEDEKRKDIATVKLIPGLLARAGFQIYRIE